VHADTGCCCWGLWQLRLVVFKRYAADSQVAGPAAIQAAGWAGSSSEEVDAWAACMQRPKVHVYPSQLLAGVPERNVPVTRAETHITTNMQVVVTGSSRKRSTAVLETPRWLSAGSEPLQPRC
jgi:hypothetical protein